VSQLPWVAIHIVTWNSREFLPTCLAGISQQEYPHLHVVLVDNASQDQSADYVEQHYPQIAVLRNAQNVGFSRAHNQAIRQSQADYILLVNPDIYLQPDYVTRAVAWMHDPATGAVAGRLFATTPADFLQGNFACKGMLDCAGMAMLRNRRLILRGNRTVDDPQFSQPTEVFGTDGALPLYRRTMLEDTKIGQEYFDEDFFAYKEDHDLAWRARLFGWNTYYAPDALAHHIRSAQPGRRKNMPGKIRILGVRNRYLMNLKNDLPALLLRDLVPILQYEVQIFGYTSLFERQTLQGYRQVLPLLPMMWQKRQHIMAHRRVPVQAMATWINA
jgi:GT2 family glycosyltransferase